MEEVQHQSNPQPQIRPMLNFSQNMIRDARIDTGEVSHEIGNPYKQQKVITFKNRDYLLYEGRIIDEREADRIYTQYHEILSQKKTTTGGAAAV